VTTADSPTTPDDAPSPDDPANDSVPADSAAVRPLVVVSGEATEEEVAALTAVVAALGAVQASASAAPARRSVSEWAARSRQVRGPHLAGPGGWRASTLPR
jgi:hypothetical protein